jgi:hypothetical protein
VKVGSTPVGHHRFSGSWAFLSGYASVYQDTRGWAEAGIHDYIAPQLYWDIGSPADGTGEDAPRFEWLVNDWMSNRFDRHIYIGTAPYKANVFREIPDQIDTTRAHQAHGQLHFRYDSVKETFIRTYPFGDRYQHPALVPPMEWMDMTAPLGPENVNATWATGTTAVTVEWDAPDLGADGTDVMRYAVYRVPRSEGPVAEPTANPEFFVGLTGETSFQDTVPAADEVYDYYVTSVSRNNVESAPASIHAAVSVDGVGLVHTFGLDQNYPNPFNPATRITYRLDSAGMTSLRVYDVLGREVAVLVNERMPAGEFHAVFDASTLASGTYVYVLEHNGQRTSSLMTLIK